MNNLTRFLALLTCTCVFGQGKVAEKVQALHLSKTNFASISPFQASTDNPSTKIQNTVAEAQLATIKFSVVNDVVSKAYETIEVEIPYHGKNIKVELYKVNLFAQGFHADTDKQKNIPYTPGVHYRGIIKDEPNSLVSFNFFHDEINAIVSSHNLSNLVIGKIDETGNTANYIIYEDQKMKVANDAECKTSDVIDKDVEEQLREIQSPLSVKCVTTYFEIDNNLYVSNGSNTGNTLNWMTSVFNNMQTLYNNDGVTVTLQSTYIWTTADPYNGIGTTSGAYLYKFKEVRPAFDGDVGQLVGIDPGGMGGVSMGIGKLCTADNYVYSDVYLSYSSVPTYSWTVQVITHEFGHNVGSRHTHACAWNGNNTAIDNCAPYAIGATAEGYSCMTTPATIPSGAEGGSIMSYCHLVGGVGINLSNGFGPQPAAAILNFVNSRTCLSADCTNLCINGVASINPVFNANNTSATVTWNDVTAESSWQVAVLPFASNAPVWNSVTTNSYTANGLSPNTYYKFRVKPDCGSMTPTTKEYIFLTPANYCSGITLTDTGGVVGKYGNNQQFVRTIVPNLPNQKIKLEFSAFSLEQDYDYLYVYDGSSTGADSFEPNGYTGASIPGPFESTAADGALTIRFFSDGGETDLGWVATTSCLASLGVEEHSYIDYAYYPNPANGIVTINSKNYISGVTVYNIEGRLLYSSEVNGLTTQVDLAGFSAGTYFFKMKVENQIVNFKVVKL
ncbi:M12 family metallo-peptidase [Flavobacterium sp.]|uniref:M12 family metallo-peptidase n=1 Tax=Flavobacterium sp. TaxID=239 RepID=UPI003D6A4EB3